MHIARTFGNKEYNTIHLNYYNSIVFDVCMYNMPMSNIYTYKLFKVDVIIYLRPKFQKKYGNDNTLQF